MKTSVFKKKATLLKPIHFSYCLIAASVLSGCQSTATTQQANTQKQAASILTSNAYQQRVNNQVQDFYSQFAETSDMKAHNTLAAAIRQHMTTDRVAVTTLRNYNDSLIKEGSVDSEAHDVFELMLISVMKGYKRKMEGGSSDEDYYDEYYEEDNGFYGPGYRTEEEYLEEPDALYLNYYDEVKDNLPSPDYAITRETGLSLDYYIVTDEVMSYVGDMDSCIIDYSSELDYIVSEDSSVTANDSEVQELKTIYQDCLDDTRSMYEESISQAQGYQKLYIKEQDVCQSRFDRHITDLFSTSRTPSDIDYDQYDSIYESYENCSDRIFTEYDLEPEYYITEEWPEYYLDYKVAMMDCSMSLTRRQEDAAEEGLTYANNPEAYREIYEDALICESQSYDDYMDAEYEAMQMYDDSDYTDIEEDADNGFYRPAYRSEETYLQEPDALYLNYVDEKTNNLPSLDYNITRIVGMSSDYEDTTRQVLDYIDEMDSCLLSYSSDLDSLVSDDPTLTEESREAKEHTLTYQSCVEETRADEDYAEMLTKAQGYQRYYVKEQAACQSRFNKNITDLFGSNRKENDIDYDQYDSIYGSYSYCHDNIYLQRDIEPIHYIAERLPEYYLDYKVELLNCNNRMNERQEAAAAKGITYGTDPKGYMEIYEDNIECEATIDRQYLDTEEAMTPPSEEEKAVNDVLKWIKRTPAQVESTNYYANQYTTLNRISEFNVSERQVNHIYSYDFVSPTALMSLQLPVGIDFNQAKVTLDPSAILPIMAVFAPEETPLPEDMTATSVAFDIPEKIIETIPPSVIYDAFVGAIGQSIEELDASYFTAIDVKSDAYAKEVGASQAIKVNLESEQTGKMLGVIVKYVVADLSRYVETHAEEINEIDDSDKVVEALEKWQEFNGKYLTDNVGALLQLVEAVAPFSLNKTSYYYLDAKGQLLAKQTRRSIGMGIMNVGSELLSQTRYSTQSFNKHPLHTLFVETYGEPFSEQTPASMDGTAWWTEMEQRSTGLKQARMARRDYDLDDDADYVDEDDSNIRDMTKILQSINFDDILR